MQKPGAGAGAGAVDQNENHTRAPLARIEGRIALARLAEGFSDLYLTDAAPDYFDTVSLRGRRLDLYLPRYLPRPLEGVITYVLSYPGAMDGTLAPRGGTGADAAAASGTRGAPACNREAPGTRSRPGISARQRRERGETPARAANASRSEPVTGYPSNCPGFSHESS